MYILILIDNQDFDGCFETTLCCSKSKNKLNEISKEASNLLLEANIKYKNKDKELDLFWINKRDKEKLCFRIPEEMENRKEEFNKLYNEYPLLKKLSLISEINSYNIDNFVFEIKEISQF